MKTPTDEAAAETPKSTTLGGGAERDLSPASEIPQSDDYTLPPPSWRESERRLEGRFNNRMDRMDSMINQLVTGITGMQSRFDKLQTTIVGKAEKPKKEETDKAVEKEPEKTIPRRWGDISSSDDEDEEQAEKKRKKNRFRPKNFTQRGEKVDNFESLMMITFRTIKELTEEGEDVSGLIDHGLLLAEKGSKACYKPEALLGYDEEIRRRAERIGPEEFGRIRYFSFDNSISNSQSSGNTRANRKKAEKVCIKLNTEAGCHSKSCPFAHKCFFHATTLVMVNPRAKTPRRRPTNRMRPPRGPGVNWKN